MAGIDKIIDNGNSPITNKEVIVKVLDLALEYGVPLVIKLIKEWQKDGPITISDVRNMEIHFKNPELYFQKDK